MAPINRGAAGTRWLSLLALVPMLLLAACGDDPIVAPIGDPQVSSLEIVSRSSGNVIAGTEGSGASAQWNGLLHLHPGDNISYGFRLKDAAGQIINLGAEYSLAANIVAGKPTNVVSVTPHSDHIDVTVIGEGETEVILSVTKGSSVIWRSPALFVEVIDHSHEEPEGPDPSGIASIKLNDRDSGEEYAHTHGSGAGMHWHGNIHIHEGDTVEVNITFLDSHGDTLRFFDAGSEFSLGVAPAAGSATDLLDIDVHGDHVKLIGLKSGTTDLRFSILHGGHSDFDSPAVEVEVEEHGPSPSDIASMRLLNRDTGTEYAHTHGSGAGMHWHGNVHLHPGDTVEVDVIFRDSERNPIDFFTGGEYTLGVSLDSSSVPGVAKYEVHGDHVKLIAERAGTVNLNISIMHGSHSDFDAPAIQIEVEDHGHGGAEPGQVASVKLFNADNDVEIAHTHGTGEGMHWHGRIHLHPNDTVEVKLKFYDSEGAELDLFASGRTLEASFVEGQPNNVIQFVSHGDHGEIRALIEGETRLVFSLKHASLETYSLPALRAEVVVH